MWMAADGLGAPLAKYGELGAEDPRQEIIDAPPDELQNSIRTFLEWSNDVLAVKECRQLVQPHGLGNRGLNPMSLVFILRDGSGDVETEERTIDGSVRGTGRSE
jgi:hypothetical protein